MKVRITSITEVQGHSLNPKWQAPMYVINGEYYSSSITQHNPDKKKLMVTIGNEYEVNVTQDKWISLKG